MSNRKKGDRNERRAKEIWEEVYGEDAVERAPGGTWTRSDFFDLFDLLVWGGSAPGMHLIQVRSEGARGIEDFAEACQPFLRYPDAFSPHMAVSYKREGWRLVGVVDGGYETFYDERKDPDVGVNQHTPLSLGDGLKRWLMVYCTGPDYPNDGLDAGEWGEYA